MWPLVSALHAQVASEQTMLCHQAGGAVMPGESPRKSGESPAGGTLHCPLCLMAFYGAAMEPPQAPPFFAVATTPLVVHPGRAAPHDLQVSLPPSRAPPFALPA